MTTPSLEERIAMRHQRGRKRVDITSSLPMPQGRDVIWAAIRKLNKFQRLDLEHETRIPLATIESYLQGLVAAGYLEKTPGGRNAKGYAPSSYELVRDCGVEAPRVTRKGKPVTQGDGRAAQWSAMRILKDFTRHELLAACRQGGQKVAIFDVADFIKHLCQAGYLRTITVRGPGRPARYQLVPARNTGPLAPQIQRIQQVFDPNLGKVVWPEPAK